MKNLVDIPYPAIKTEFTYLNSFYNSQFILTDLSKEQYDLIENGEHLFTQSLYVSSSDFKQQLSRVSIISNFLIIRDLIKQQSPLIIINIELANLEIVYSELNVKIGFKISRQNQVFTFIFKKSQNTEIKRWVIHLNKYVIKLGKIGNYARIELLGKGTEGKVYKIQQLPKIRCQQEREPKIFAMKVIKKKLLNTNSKYRFLINEILLQRKMGDCETVVRLLKIYEDESKISLVMEYKQGGTLDSRIRNGRLFSEEEAKQIIYKLLKAASQMKNHQILHRDLKPSNILMNSISIDNPDISITDFGFSIQSTGYDNENLKMCGTPGYIAPEILNQHKFIQNQDIFSIGVILFNLITGKVLFKGPSVDDILKKNKECDLTHLHFQILGFSVDLKNLLYRMLDHNPSTRISANEALRHPWFKNYMLLTSSVSLNLVQKCETFIFQKAHESHLMSTQKEPGCVRHHFTSKAINDSTDINLQTPFLPLKKMKTRKDKNQHCSSKRRKNIFEKDQVIEQAIEQIDQQDDSLTPIKLAVNLRSKSNFKYSKKRKSILKPVNRIISDSKERELERYRQLNDILQEQNDDDSPQHTQKSSVHYDELIDELEYESLQIPNFIGYAFNCQKKTMQEINVVHEKRTFLL